MEQLRTEHTLNQEQQWLNKERTLNKEPTLNREPTKEHPLSEVELCNTRGIEDTAENLHPGYQEMILCCEIFYVFKLEIIQL